MGRKVTFRAGMTGAERDIEVEIHDADCEPWGVDARLDVVGTDVPRLDGPAKVTGTAKYTMDVRPEGMLWAGFVTSPHAHAEVESIDASEALGVPGVLEVNDASEGARSPTPARSSRPSARRRRRPSTTRWPRIRVEYGSLPHVGDDRGRAAGGRAAGRSVAARPHPVGRARSRKPGRGAAGRRGGRGASASGTWRTQIQTHSALEPHGTVSRLESDGSATVWASTQSTTSVRGPRGARSA